MLKQAANTLATRPPPQSRVNIGVHIIFAIGAINGSCVKIATDKGCEQMLAAKVKESALLIISGHFGHGNLIQYSKREENIIIPKVDPADNAKDTETLVSAFKLIRIIMHNPSAFRGAGLLLPKKENIAI